MKKGWGGAVVAGVVGFLIGAVYGLTTEQDLQRQTLEYAESLRKKAGRDPSKDYRDLITLLTS